MAPLKTTPGRTSGLMDVDKDLPWLLCVFHATWMSSWRSQRPGSFLYEKVIQRTFTSKKAKSIPVLQDLLSWKSSTCGDLNPCFLFDIGTARRRPGPTSTNTVKGPLLSHVCTSKHLGGCSTGIWRWGLLLHSMLLSQGSGVSPGPLASEWAGTVTGFRHLI